MNFKRTKWLNGMPKDWQEKNKNRYKVVYLMCIEVIAHKLILFELKLLFSFDVYLAAL